MVGRGGGKLQLTSVAPTRGTRSPESSPPRSPLAGAAVLLGQPHQQVWLLLTITATPAGAAEVELMRLTVSMWPISNRVGGPHELQNEFETHSEVRGDSRPY